MITRPLMLGAFSLLIFCASSHSFSKMFFDFLFIYLFFLVFGVIRKFLLKVIMLNEITFGFE